MLFWERATVHCRYGKPGEGSLAPRCHSGRISHVLLVVIIMPDYSVKCYFACIYGYMAAQRFDLGIAVA